MALNRQNVQDVGLAAERQAIDTGLTTDRPTEDVGLTTDRPTVSAGLIELDQRQQPQEERTQVAELYPVPLEPERSTEEMAEIEKMILEGKGEPITTGRMLYQAEHPLWEIDYYGSFHSWVDFGHENVKFDNETQTYSGLYLISQPNLLIPGYENLSQEVVPIPDGKTKGEIIKLKKQIDRNIMGSGDLTYREDLWMSSFAETPKGVTLAERKHFETPWAIRLAEETITPQGLRALFNILPLSSGFFVGKKILGFGKGFKLEKAPSLKRFWTAFGAGVGTSAAVYYFLNNQADWVTKKYGGEKADFNKWGYAAVLYALQESEVMYRGLDRTKTRTLSVEQYAAMLDPVFATYWTKFANTLTEGAISTLTFMKVGGMWTLSPTGSRYIKNVYNRASETLDDVNKVRLSEGLKPLAKTDKNIIDQARFVLGQDKLDLKTNMYGMINRFLYGYPRTQQGARLIRGNMYWGEIGVSELGAGGLVSAAAYYARYGKNSFNISPRTEELDKLPILLFGATFAPGAVVRAPFIGTRGFMSPVSWTVSGLRNASEMLGSPRAAEFFAWVQGTTTAFPKGLSKGQEEVLIQLKSQIGHLDVELGGKMLASMQSGSELSSSVEALSKKIAKEYNDPNLIITQKNTLATFIQMETIHDLERYVLNSVLTGKGSIKDLNKTHELLLLAKGEAVKQNNALLEKLLLLDQRTGGNLDSEHYLKLRKTLIAGIKQLTKKSNEYENVLKQTIQYGMYQALDGMIENPHKGYQHLDKIKALLETPEGQVLKFKFGNEEILSNELIDIVYKKAGEELERAYEIAWKALTLEENSKIYKTNQYLDGTPVEIDAKVKNINRSKAERKSSETFAKLLHLRVDRLKAKKNELYKNVWGGKEGSTIDVTELYMNMSVRLDDIDSSSLVGTDALKHVEQARYFFKSAILESIDDFMSRVTDEGTYEAGVKQLKEIVPELQKLGINIRKADFVKNDPNSLARVLLNKKEIRLPDGNTMPQSELIAQALGIPEFRLEIGTIDFEQGFRNLSESAELIARRLKVEGGSKASKELGVLDILLTQLDNTLSDNLSQADEAALEVARKFFIKNVAIVRETSLFKNTLFNAVNYDPEAVTGQYYRGGFGNPVSWVPNWLDSIKSSADAEEAMDDFFKIFGDGSDETDKIFSLAQKAVDDTLLSQYFLGKELTLDKLPLVQTIEPKKIVDQPQGEVAGELTGPFIREKAYGVQPPEKPKVQMDEFERKLEWIRDASDGRFQLANSVDVFEKVRLASTSSLDARNNIAGNLKLLANEYTAKELAVKTMIDQYKVVMKYIAKDLDTSIDMIGRPGDLVGKLLDEPNRMEAVFDIMRRTLGEDEARNLMRMLLGKGISNIIEEGAIVGRIKTPSGADTGIDKIQKTYDPLALSQLMDENEKILRAMLGSEHYNTLKIYSRFAVRFTPKSKNVTRDYGMTMKPARHFKLSHASMISRVYAAESGRTSFRYIGAEAVIGVLLNSNNNVLAALFTNPKIARELVEFLSNPKIPLSHAGANTVTWIHELTGLSQALGGAIFQLPEAMYIGVAGTEEEKARDLPVAEAMQHFLSGINRRRIRKGEEDPAYMRQLEGKREAYEELDKSIWSDIRYIFKEIGDWVKKERYYEVPEEHKKNK